MKSNMRAMFDALNDIEQGIGKTAQTKCIRRGLNIVIYSTDYQSAKEFKNELIQIGKRFHNLSEWGDDDDIYGAFANHIQESIDNEYLRSFDITTRRYPDGSGTAWKIKLFTLSGARKKYIVNVSGYGEISCK